MRAHTTMFKSQVIHVFQVKANWRAIEIFKSWKKYNIKRYLIKKYFILFPFRRFKYFNHLNNSLNMKNWDIGGFEPVTNVLNYIIWTSWTVQFNKKDTKNYCLGIFQCIFIEKILKIKKKKVTKKIHLRACECIINKNRQKIFHFFKNFL